MRELARAEFAHDSGGKPYLDRAHFKQAWFQLADTWTEEISAPAYRAFLRQLVHVMSEDTVLEDVQRRPVRPLARAW